MTAATLTPAAAGTDLLDELRQLLARHDGAATLDEVRELADELTGVLRRTRGRLGRLARKAAPNPAPEKGGAAARESNPHLRAAVDRPGAPTASAERTATMPLPRPADAPPLSAYRVSPLEDAALLQGRKQRSYGDYQRTVLCCELGSRAYGALAVPHRTVARLVPAHSVPVPRQIGAVRYVLAAVAVLTQWAGRRITKAVRRACGALAVAVSAR